MIQVSVVRDERHRKRMTQAHLAKAAGVSERTVRRLEEGLDVSPESVRCICSVLEIDAGKLRRGDAPGSRRMGTFDFHTPEGACLPLMGINDGYCGGVELAYIGPGLSGNVFLCETIVAACLDSVNRTGSLPLLVSFQIGDITGPSSDSFWRALPAKSRNLVKSIALTAGPEGSINPLDTPYGIRVPTPFQYETMTNILSLVAGALSGDTIALVAEVVAPLMRKAYAIEKSYLPGEVPEVDDALHDRPGTWWEAAEMLRRAEAQLSHVMAAQRLAVPCPDDLPPILEALIGEGTFTGDTLIVAQAILRKLPHFLGAYGFFGGATRIPHVDAQAVMINMWGAMRFGRGHNPSYSLVYLLARSLMPDAQHDGRGERMTIVDNYQLYQGEPGVDASVLADAKSARERGVRVMVKSQCADSFSGPLAEMADIRWGYGSVRRQSAEEAEAVLGLDASVLRRDAVQVILARNGEQARISLHSPNRPLMTPCGLDA